MVVQAVADMSAAVHTAIIGCGNPNRSDDGLGPAVATRLRATDLPPGVAVFDAGTDGMAVMYRARGVERLIIVDAKVPENNPGAIYQVPGDILQAPPQHSLNLHDFRWENALYAGRMIYGEAFPGDVSVFLVEAESLALGLGLSPAVEAAEGRLAEQIAALVTPEPAEAP